MGSEVEGPDQTSALVGKKEGHGGSHILTRYSVAAGSCNGFDPVYPIVE